MDDKGERFPREERIRTRGEFLGVCGRGAKVQGAHFVLYILENKLPYHRLGITVSRKIGPSIIRNRIKRRLREAFRRNKKAISPPCDLVINAKRTAAGCQGREVQEDFLKSIKRWKRRAQKRRGEAR